MKNQKPKTKNKQPYQLKYCDLSTPKEKTSKPSFDLRIMAHFLPLPLPLHQSNFLAAALMVKNKK